MADLLDELEDRLTPVHYPVEQRIFGEEPVSGGVFVDDERIVMVCACNFDAGYPVGHEVVADA